MLMVCYYCSIYLCICLLSDFCVYINIFSCDLYIAMSNVFKEDVIAVKFDNTDANPPVKVDENGVLWIRILKDKNDQKGWFANEIKTCELKNLKNKEIEISQSVTNKDCEWVPIKGAFKYITKNPWRNIPLITKTFITNSSLCCVSGGMNKNLQTKAHNIFNNEMNGLKINIPPTKSDVEYDFIPLMVKSFGNVAVVKSPYGNSGTDVHIIRNSKELNQFMLGKHNAPEFGGIYIVQALIGDKGRNIHSKAKEGAYYHVGTIPDENLNSYAADLRIMIQYDYINNTWNILNIYSTRAKEPLGKIDNKYNLRETISSWDILGMNLTVQNNDNSSKTDVDRLILMDKKDFNTLGIGLDDLIQAYIQAILSTIAIDKMATKFVKESNDGTTHFNRNYFYGLCNDIEFIQDIRYQ